MTRAVKKNWRVRVGGPWNLTLGGTEGLNARFTIGESRLTIGVNPMWGPGEDKESSEKKGEEERGLWLLEEEKYWKEIEERWMEEERKFLEKGNAVEEDIVGRNMVEGNKREVEKEVEKEEEKEEEWLRSLFEDT